MNRPSEPGAPAPGGDPWAAFGYLVAGVALYGCIGWGVSVWLHAEYWIPIGILVGAGFGMYLVYARYRVTDPEAHPRGSRSDETSSDAATDDADDAARARRPDSDDRGETA